MQSVRIEHEEAIVRIAVDYIEMPDLIVTARQAQRLWKSRFCDASACRPPLGRRI